ncbi:MAG TPA: alpha-L-rhamnosidase [Verrucomicrobia bacterium]|nr:alpha-L-rhamnosidase [Verrucomicrobiota bacterium]
MTMRDNQYLPTRTYVPPTRIVWVSGSGDQSSVSSPGMLLEKRYGQVPEGKFLDGSGCRMENKGAIPSVLVDFGCELHGGLHLACGGPSRKGTKVRVRFGESVAEAMAELGERGACNDHAIRDSVIDLPWAGGREIGNTGFRFVRVDLVTEGVLSLESLRAISLMRPMPPLGSFSCSDERLNQVWATAARTVHLCCQDYLWDGIKRDRLVWMGDMHPEMMATLAVFGNQAVLTDSLDYMRDTTPADGWMNTMPSYTLWWIRCQHDLYLYSGDGGYLRKHHDYIKAVFANLATLIGPEGRCALPSGFLDWPTQHNRAAVDAGMQALMVMVFEDGVRLAAALGDDDLAGVCRLGAERLRRYVPSPEGSKQVAALLALSGLRPAREMQASVLGVNGIQGVSTFYGYYMLEAMAKAGEIQQGIDTVRDYWGGMLDMGATSFWEDFDIEWTRNAFRIDELPVPGKQDIHGDFGQFCYKGFRHSLCHGWAAGPAPWLIAHVLGIQVVESGCRKVWITPFLGNLDWAEGTFPTPMGVIKVRHERKTDGKVKSQISLPAGVVQ